MRNSFVPAVDKILKGLWRFVVSVWRVEGQVDVCSRLKWRFGKITTSLWREGFFIKQTLFDFNRGDQDFTWNELRLRFRKIVVLSMNFSRNVWSKTWDFPKYFPTYKNLKKTRRNFLQDELKFIFVININQYFILNI